MARFPKSSQILLPIGFVVIAVGVIIHYLRDAWPLVILTGLVVFVAGLFPMFHHKPREKNKA
jgi:uncharacterized protein YjeT (DUF2065 family)